MQAEKFRQMVNEDDTIIGLRDDNYGLRESTFSKESVSIHREEHYCGDELC
jgi:hypothetical protein